MWVIGLLFVSSVSLGCGGAELAGQAVETRSAVEILVAKCGTCHGGPYLDFRRFPFTWDRGRDLVTLMRASWARIEKEGWGRMPPVNAPALTTAEREIVRAWIDAGLPSP